MKDRTPQQMLGWRVAGPILLHCTPPKRVYNCAATCMGHILDCGSTCDTQEPPERRDINARHSLTGFFPCFLQSLRYTTTLKETRHQSTTRLDRLLALQSSMNSCFGLRCGLSTSLHHPPPLPLRLSKRVWLDLAQILWDVPQLSDQMKYSSQPDLGSDSTVGRGSCRGEGHPAETPAG